MNEAYFKNFDAWNEQAKKLNDSAPDVFANEKEIWWCALGVNIGSELDGKNELFERPVLVIKKINSDLYLVAPLSSKIYIDNYRIYTESTGYMSQIVLSQIRVISNKRFIRKICYVQSRVFLKILIQLSQMFFQILQNETPP